ncbi:MAG TPA: TIGR02147 family protein [Bdellovibrio sp.]|nr:TIGR02147 family protein [Bdellovibrio sp.]
MVSSIFEFHNYRKYLSDWIEAARKEKRSNLTQLAKVAQVHTTYLSQVLSGQKDLNLEQASLIADDLQLTSLEKEYFFTLIQLERAGNQNLKRYLQEKKTDLEKQKNNLAKRFEKFKQLSDEEKSQFYSTWIYVAIFVSTDISGGQTLEQVADRFRLSRQEADDILSFLCRTGLCQLHNGKYKLGENHIHVSSDSPFVYKHHTNWRIKSLSQMERKNLTNLFFTSPMSVSEQDYKLVREKANLFIQEVVRIAKDSKSEGVVCLNLDFFKVE